MQQKSQQVEQHWFSPDEVAFCLNVNRRTVYSYMEKAKLPYHLLPSGRRRIEYQYLNKLLNISSVESFLPDHLSVKEAGIYFGVSRFMIYKWIKNRIIESNRLNGKLTILRSDLLSILRDSNTN